MNLERIDRANAARGIAIVVLTLLLASAIRDAAAPCAADTAPAAPSATSDTVVAPPAASMERMAGTVRAVDSRAHTLVLMTGVGYALRVVRITVPPGVAIRGSASGPPTLEPGCIVRVECQHAGAARAESAPRVASAVTVLAPAPRPRTP
jgi:hypothetical protein